MKEAQLVAARRSGARGAKARQVIDRKRRGSGIERETRVNRFLRLRSVPAFTDALQSHSVPSWL